MPVSEPPAIRPELKSVPELISDSLTAPVRRSIPRISTPRLLWRLLSLLLQLPGRWGGLTVYRGQRVVVTTPRRREVLTVRRRALPLLVPPGAVEAVAARVVNDAPTPTSPTAVSPTR